MEILKTPHMNVYLEHKLYKSERQTLKPMKQNCTFLHPLNYVDYKRARRCTSVNTVKKNNVKNNDYENYVKLICDWFLHDVAHIWQNKILFFVSENCAIDQFSTAPVNSNYLPDL